MKQRLADYVAVFLAAHGVTDVFFVVGGEQCTSMMHWATIPDCMRPITTMSRPALLLQKPMLGWKIKLRRFVLQQGRVVRTH